MTPSRLTGTPLAGRSGSAVGVASFSFFSSCRACTTASARLACPVGPVVADAGLKEVYGAAGPAGAVWAGGGGPQSMRFDIDLEQPSASSGTPAAHRPVVSQRRRRRPGKRRKLGRTITKSPRGRDVCRQRALPDRSVGRWCELCRELGLPRKSRNCGEVEAGGRSGRLG